MSDVRTVMETIPPPVHSEIVHPRIMPDGVYFGLDEERYHDALALSASGIKNLRISTLDFWARSSVLNPNYQDEDSEAKMIGRAYDRRIVEGREVFYRHYAAALDPADYPDVVRTTEEIKARLRTAGAKLTGNKPELIERLLAIEPMLKIWDEELRRHGIANAGKTLLARDLIGRIEIAAAMIEKHPQLGKAFTGGQPQVSIFWRDRDSGVPCKARMDYWKPRVIVDLKTFANQRGMPIDKAIAFTVASYKYHIQAAFYLEARRQAMMLIDAGQVFGSIDAAFVKAVRAAPDCTFMFVFQQKGIAPLARGKVMPPSTTLDIGQLEMDEAKLAFAFAWERFGTDPWLDVADITTFDPTEFPAFLAD